LGVGGVGGVATPSGLGYFLGLPLPLLGLTSSILASSIFFSSAISLEGMTSHNSVELWTNRDGLGSVLVFCSTGSVISMTCAGWDWFWPIIPDQPCISLPKASPPKTATLSVFCVAGATYAGANSSFALRSKSHWEAFSELPDSLSMFPT